MDDFFVGSGRSIGVGSGATGNFGRSKLAYSVFRVNAEISFLVQEILTFQKILIKLFYNLPEYKDVSPYNDTSRIA